MSENTIEITDSNFEQSKQKNPLLIVDCWADWCMPCKMIAPMIERLAEEHKGKIVLGKDGELIDQIVGALPYDMLNSKIEGYL